MVATGRGTRLKEFLAAWRTLKHRAPPDVARLAAFLDASRERLQVQPSVPPSASTMDARMLDLVLGELRGALNRARSEGAGFNPWTVAGLRRNEVRACAVLAALWNPTMCGEAAVRFFAEFVGELRGINGLPNEAELGQDYVVRTEHILQGDRTTRMDITIEGRRFVLVIEVKVDAPEGRKEGNESQFDRIRARTNTWAQNRGKRPLFALLSPLKPPDNFTDAYTDWRAVARAARRCLPRERAAYTFHDHLLAGFANHVTGF